MLTEKIELDCWVCASPKLTYLSAAHPFESTMESPREVDVSPSSGGTWKLCARCS